MFMRIYTGADGESHFEDMSGSVLDGQFGTDAGGVHAPVALVGGHVEE